jgi:hypothetical protein
MWREHQLAARVEGREARTMVETLATTALPPEFATPGKLKAIRAEALFASTLQPSAQASPEEVFRNVATTLRRLGPRGCAALMAAEFGDHPEAAVARMNWAQTTIDTAYPTPLPSMTPTANLRPFAQAC